MPTFKPCQGLNRKICIGILQEISDRIRPESELSERRNRESANKVFEFNSVKFYPSISKNLPDIAFDYSNGPKTNKYDWAQPKFLYFVKEVIDGLIKRRMLLLMIR